MQLADNTHVLKELTDLRNRIDIIIRDVTARGSNLAGEVQNYNDIVGAVADVRPIVEDAFKQLLKRINGGK